MEETRAFTLFLLKHAFWYHSLLRIVPAIKNKIISNNTSCNHPIHTYECYSNRDPIFFKNYKHVYRFYNINNNFLLRVIKYIRDSMFTEYIKKIIIKEIYIIKEILS